MDDILENVMKMLETRLKKEGKPMDAKYRAMIKESLKNQIFNLPEDQKQHVLGLLSSHIKR